MTKLILCPAIEDLWILERHANSSRVVVASDDPRVHQFCNNRRIEASWMEDARSIYTVAERVKNAIRDINAWFARVGEQTHGMPQSVLFWPQHVEGGYTTQRVQDAFLLVDAFQNLIARYEPTELVVAASSRFLWEAEVAREVGRGAGIRTTIETRNQWNAVRSRVNEWWQLLAREPHRLAFVVRARFRRDDRRPTPVDVVVQVCDSAVKHREQARDILQAFQDKGWQARAACWRAPRASVAFRNAGIPADDLEGWVTWKEVAQSAGVSIQTWRNLIRSRFEFQSLPSLVCGSVRLADCLWPSVRFTCLAELPDRVRLFHAFRRYFATRQPRAVRFWTTVLPQAVIAWTSLPASVKPLVFHAPGFPYDRVDPYEHRVVPVDLELAVSDRHRELLAQDEFPSARIVVIGHDRLDVVRRHAASYTQEESRRRLDIPQEAGLVVFYDSGQIMRGYLSAKEQMLTTTTLMTFAKAHPQVVLLIKPHPSHTPGSLESQLREYHLPNTRVIGPSDPPYTGLSAADVVITKRSTVGVEGMYFGRPLIATMFDGEERFREFGDAAEYVRDPAALERSLETLLTSDRDVWVSEATGRIAAYLGQIVTKCDDSAARNIAQAVIDVAA